MRLIKEIEFELGKAQERLRIEAQRSGEEVSEEIARYRESVKYYNWGKIGGLKMALEIFKLNKES